MLVVLRLSNATGWSMVPVRNSTTLHLPISLPPPSVLKVIAFLLFFLFPSPQ